MWFKPKRDERLEQKKQELLPKVFLMLAKQFGVNQEQVTPQSRLIEDLGMESLDSVEIVMAMEEEFDIEIPDEDSDKFKTADDVLTYVARQVNRQSLQ